MRGVLLLHIAAGGLALVAGYIALFSAKGARLHRKSGLLFVYAMVAMGVSATLVAGVRGIDASLLGGGLAAYLVMTALTTVRPASRRADLALVLLALALGAGLIATGFEALASPGDRLDGIPAVPILVNGAIALMAVTGDVRILRKGVLRGAPRITRHMWRMCFALFIAAGSFFLGQADELPQPLRIFPLLALPVLAVLGAMVYWLWRLRVRRSLPVTPGFSSAL